MFTLIRCHRLDILKFGPATVVWLDFSFYSLFVYWRLLFYVFLNENTCRGYSIEASGDTANECHNKYLY